MYYSHTLAVQIIQSQVKSSNMYVKTNEGYYDHITTFRLTYG